MSGLRVRRHKAELSSGCKAHPANAPAGSNRSNHGGNEVAEGVRLTRRSSSRLAVAPTFPHVLPLLSKRPLRRSLLIISDSKCYSAMERNWRSLEANPVNADNAHWRGSQRIS